MQNDLEPSRARPPRSSQEAESSRTLAGATARPNGLPLATYAALHGLSEAEVWRRIRRGQLAARQETHRNESGEEDQRLMVYEDTPATGLDHDRVEPAMTPRSPQAERSYPRFDRDAEPYDALHDLPGFPPIPDVTVEAPRFEGVAEASMVASDGGDASELRLDGLGDDLQQPDVGDLPPLPPPGADAEAAAPGSRESSGILGRAGASGGGFLSLSGRPGETPELALLLDHLSLAKEENREILRLTQDSIRRVTELTDTIVEMKDQVIDAKDAQILALEQRLKAQEADIKALRQQNEDLDTLARAALAERGPAPRA